VPIAKTSPARRAFVFVAVALVTLVGCVGQSAHRTISATIVDGKPGFSPDVVSVHKGDHVDLTVRNTTDKTHGFEIEGYRVTRLIDPTAPTVHVKFTAHQGGTFRIFCQLHEKHQTATLVVA